VRNVVGVRRSIAELLDGGGRASRAGRTSSGESHPRDSHPPRFPAPFPRPVRTQARSCRYASALSAALWQRLFAADPFSRQAGEAYRREVLAKGAAVDPVGVLERVLGGPPTMEPLLREMGLLPA
jgi:hypothetical protein